MTTTVYLVRHGRTGPDRRHLGWQDPSLDATGLAQARAAGLGLAKHRLDAVHASSLQRARATAEALRVGRAGVPLVVDERLRELHYGELTGLDKRAHPARLWREHLDEPLPGGESLSDLGVRVRAYLADVLAPALQRGESVAVVAHFWSLRHLLVALRGQDLTALLEVKDYRPDHGSVHALTVTRTAAGWRGSGLATLELADANRAATWAGGDRWP